MMSFEDYCQNELDQLEAKNLRRFLRVIQGPQSRAVRVNGRACLNFCSNDYLGLAGDERLTESARRALQDDGVGAGASRLVCGTLSAHEKLEARLAVFKGTAASLVFSTGYMANTGIIPALFGRGDLILGDRLNHASIIDGIILSRAAFKRYPHRDVDALEKLLRQSAGYRRKVVITDSVFSMDGDLAPLPDITRVARAYDCLVMIDDAHGTGVLGAHGKGAMEHFGLTEGVDIQMGTLSKALGASGAFCCGPRALIELLVNKARSFIYTTALPPSIAAAAVTALDIVRDERSRREKLWRRTNFLRDGLKAAGFDTGASQTPVIPVLIKDDSGAVEFSRRLLESGFWVPAIRPPAVPAGTARLRVTVTAGHEEDDVHKLVEAMTTIGKDLCLV